MLVLGSVTGLHITVGNMYTNLACASLWYATTGTYRERAKDF